jgi:hypothetical protein
MALACTPTLIRQNLALKNDALSPTVGSDIESMTRSHWEPGDSARSSTIWTYEVLTVVQANVAYLQYN